MVLPTVNLAENVSQGTPNATSPRLNKKEEICELWMKTLPEVVSLSPRDQLDEPGIQCLPVPLNSAVSSVESELISLMLS